jgi:hypothetical protein
MIKQQNIFFDNSLDFNTTGGGIIENDTETLNLFLMIIVTAIRCA